MEEKGIRMSTPEEPKKNLFTEKLEALRKNEKVEGFYNYATSNTRDTVAYILMIIGIVLLFSHPFYGGLMVGIVFGLYYSERILAVFNASNDLIEHHGMVRSLIFGGLLLALLILAWPLYLGIAIAIAIRHILYPESLEKPKE